VPVLHGRVRLVADAVEWEGRDGDLLIVPQARHALHALEDAAVLLTVANCHRRRASHSPVEYLGI
jgi:quercetin dioxygenase-like cupin family protein